MKIISWVIILIISVTASFFVGKISSDNDLTNNTDYTFIDPARSLIPQKYFFVTLQPLRTYLIDLVTDYESKYNLGISLYLESLNTGGNISINPEKSILPASLTKLPVAIIATKKIEEGKWNLDTKLTLGENEKDSTSGDLYLQPLGTKILVTDLIKLSLQASDNTAHLMLLNNLSAEELNQFWAAVGLEEVFNSKGELKAKEYSRILRALYSASYLEQNNSNEILSYLSKSNFKNYISLGLPANIPFAHKYGRNLELSVYADSGIVYIAHQPYLVSVLIKGNKPEDETVAKEFMKNVGEESYKFFSQGQ